jgi:[ribosomal protein S18]-alanine N-acetyltransferase
MPGPSQSARRVAEAIAATVEDAAALASLHAASFERPWSESDFRLFLQDGALGLVIRDGGAVTSFVLLRAVLDEAEVLTIATDPARRGQGLASSLLAAAVPSLARAGVATLWLEVAADNAPALALYARTGFRETGRRRGYYPRVSGAVDALLMARAILSPTGSGDA